MSLKNIESGIPVLSIVTAGSKPPLSLPAKPMMSEREKKEEKHIEKIYQMTALTDKSNQCHRFS